QLGGCGRVGDCRSNFCGEGPVRGGRGPFLYSWAGLLSAPFSLRAGWHTADASDDRLGSPAATTGSAASLHCSQSFCCAFSPVSAVLSEIAVVRRRTEVAAHGLEASSRHGRVGASLEPDAVAPTRRVG